MKTRFSLTWLPAGLFADRAPPPDIYITIPGVIENLNIRVITP